MTGVTACFNFTGSLINALKRTIVSLSVVQCSTTGNKLTKQKIMIWETRRWNQFFARNFSKEEIIFIEVENFVINVCLFVRLFSRDEWIGGVDKWCTEKFSIIKFWNLFFPVTSLTDLRSYFWYWSFTLTNVWWSFDSSLCARTSKHATAKKTFSMLIVLEWNFLLHWRHDDLLWALANFLLNRYKHAETDDAIELATIWSLFENKTMWTDCSKLKSWMKIEKCAVDLKNVILFWFVGKREDR